MMNKMDFQQQLKNWNDRELLEFLALQQFDMCAECVSRRSMHEARISTLEEHKYKTLERLKKLESSDRRIKVLSGVIAGITSAVVSVIAFIATVLGLKR